MLCYIVLPENVMENCNQALRGEELTGEGFAAGAILGRAEDKHTARKLLHRAATEHLENQVGVVGQKDDRRSFSGCFETECDRVVVIIEQLETFTYAWVGIVRHAESNLHIHLVGLNKLELGAQTNGHLRRERTELLTHSASDLHTGTLRAGFPTFTPN